MISDLQIADLLVALYDGGAGFDVVEGGDGDDGICWASKRVEGADVICLRGSVTFLDWVRDFVAVPSPFKYKALGPVHPGFAIGMTAAWKEIREKTLGPWIVAGHSLGAGRAAILAGMMVADGLNPQRLVTFGQPKPGFEQLRGLLNDIPKANYRNGNNFHHDLVTDVPLTLAFPPFPYIHPAAFTMLNAPPGGDLYDQYGVFAWHHMPLYRQGLAILTPGG